MCPQACSRGFGCSPIRPRQFSVPFQRHFGSRTLPKPPITTGDGLAMGIRDGVKTADIHWVQFHPTALVSSGNDRAFLLTEALRGAGAYIVNSLGRRFLFDSLPKGELAPRDLICSAIWEEISIIPFKKEIFSKFIWNYSNPCN